MRSTNPLEIITQALERRPGVSDWQVQRTLKRSVQLFQIGSKTEARRLVSTDQVQIKVYNDHPPHNQAGLMAAGGAGRVPEEGHRGSQAPSGDFNRCFGSNDSVGMAGTTTPLARGASSRILLVEEIMDQARLERDLEEAVFIAGLTDNPPYSLPEPPINGFPIVETTDSLLAGSDDARLKVLETLRERLLAAIASEPNIHLSSAEWFATISEIRLCNSRGILAGRSETEISCDLVLLASNDEQIAEYHTAPQRRRLADLDIEGIVHRSARYARDSLRANLTSTHRGPVVISGEALVDLFAPLIFHSSAQAAYQSMSRFALGCPICGEQEVQGDRLTLISNALLPYGQASMPFSEEGLPGERLVVIKDHQLQAWWAGQRYADYLNISPTGSFANIEIPPGTHPMQDLLDGTGPIYQLVAFSWLNPDELTGDFVAEIKLGYRLGHGHITPIKGGSLSGNLFGALAAARFSQEMQFTGGYLGPAATRFEWSSISGD
jgi:predicted Zn-dependent protease